LASGVAGDGGPRFDQNVPPGGYAWWYVDAFSEDQQFGLSIIAFIGSVFSPYYAWSGRRDPLDHCAMNIALYGPRGARWAMTERRRAALRRDATSLEIGPSAMKWDGRSLEIDINEISAPWPHRLRGHVRVEPETINPRAFTLESQGSHVWRPIAPIARVSAEFSQPDIKWSGNGYFDSNFGDEPLEAGFRRWTWSRARTRGGSAILYDAERRREGPLVLGLEFDRSGGFAAFAPPPVVALPRTRWRIERTTRSEHGGARIIDGFEDTPFYSRSMIDHALLGERVSSMHESLDLDRFANPLVRAMLPFRMPRI
jgi:carotenoid 1,2-hydratase